MKASQEVQLVPVDQIRPSTYNPRRASPARLDYLELSLRKLGFVTPLYADVDGEIISGHQRHHVSTTRLGLTHVPAVILPSKDLDARKSINVLFNRATNDQKQATTTTDLASQVQQRAERIQALAETLPDREGEAMHRCYPAHREPIKPLLKANRGHWDRYLNNVAGRLWKNKIPMPVLVGPDDQIINGIGRLEKYAEHGQEDIWTVRLSEHEVEFSDTMVNLLTMDFDIETRYADMLRYNSFRRRFGGEKKQIALAMTFLAYGVDVMPGRINLLEPDNQQKFLDTYGHSILDFGAGIDSDAPIVRTIGASCDSFEPYRMREGTAEIDPDLSRRVMRKTLELLAVNEYSTVFQNSIMNSVPFRDDREKIITIIAALCSRTTKVCACAADETNPQYRTTHGATPSLQVTDSFAIGYEPRTKLGVLGYSPKAQKYHTPAEWKELWETGFESVVVMRTCCGCVGCVCTKPKPLDVDRLREALEFEFDLPYPDGSRLGLVDEAKAAFEQRLGITF